MTALSFTEIVFVTLAAAITCIVAGASWFRKIKARWISEVKQTETLAANTNAVKGLTHAVNGLSARMDRVEDRLDIRN